MPTPSAIGVGEFYPFAYIDGETFSNNKDRLEEYFYLYVKDDIEGTFSEPDVDFDDVQAFVDMNMAGVAETDLDAEYLTGALEEEGDFEEASEYGGFTVYLEDEQEVAFGVRDGAVAYGQSGMYGWSNPRNRLKGVIDAKTGSGKHYPEVSDPVALITERLGKQTFIAGREHSSHLETAPAKGRFDGQIARARALDLTGEETTATFLRILESDASISESTAEAWATKWPKLARMADVSVSVDGRVVSATGIADRAATDEFYD
ncbi:hypothetical protein HARCEL1_00225 [Halococcoides cellulosivorans]|uniref:Uncharacterized protein n=2 Tax=Halococcoides cellulosivorans TaxID=1679096 RepID=A0A2R4WXJ2_9EURY|nr:hypothetical protein HARCEL1_00225 [Halococcoides cellulosivorans]